MTEAELRIRTARPDDAERLARVAEETFRDTFGALNTAEDMALHCRQSYSDHIQAREILAADMLTLLAEVGEELVGYAQLRWGTRPQCIATESAAEIQRLYVVRAWHGRGVAQQLMETSLSEIARRGSDLVWLGVWEKNPRAIAFYRKFGFDEVGAHVFPLGSDPQRDIVMARPIRR